MRGYKVASLSSQYLLICLRPAMLQSAQLGDVSSTILWSRPLFAIELQSTHRERSVSQGQATWPFGQKFELRGIVQTPSGRPLRVVTIWIIRAGEKFPRFVTAYPGRPR